MGRWVRLPNTPGTEASTAHGNPGQSVVSAGDKPQPATVANAAGGSNEMTEQNPFTTGSTGIRSLPVAAPALAVHEVTSGEHGRPESMHDLVSGTSGREARRRSRGGARFPGRDLWVTSSPWEGRRPMPGAVCVAAATRWAYGAGAHAGCCGARGRPRRSAPTPSHTPAVLPLGARSGRLLREALTVNIAALDARRWAWVVGGGSLLPVGSREKENGAAACRCGSRPRRPRVDEINAGKVRTE